MMFQQNSVVNKLHSNKNKTTMITSTFAPLFVLSTYKQNKTYYRVLVLLKL